MARVFVVAVLAGLAVSLLAAAAPPAATQTTTVVAAAADAYVDAGSPTTSFGTRTYLWVDGDPVRRGFLRFDVPPLPGPVVRATLSFQVDSGASRGLDVRAVPASDWDEATITHANAPTPAAVVGASSGALTTGTRATVDVTPLVAGAGALTLALTTTTTTRIQLASRELGAATAPQLEIVSEGTPAPDTTPPSTPPGFAVAAVTPTTISTAWSASQDDVGIAGYRLLVGGVVVATTTVTAYTFTGLPCETPHDLAVEAYDAAGNVSGAAHAAATTEACPTVVPAAVETEPVPHAGDAADDPAIWVDPADPGRSVVIGTDKQGGIAVYDLSGAQLEYRPDGLINNVDLRQGVQLGGQSVTLVAASDRSVARRIAVYKLDPATRTLVDVAARPLAAGFEPEGICLYRSPDTGIL